MKFKKQCKDLKINYNLQNILSENHLYSTILLCTKIIYKHITVVAYKCRETSLKARTKSVITNCLQYSTNVDRIPILRKTLLPGTWDI